MRVAVIGGSGRFGGALAWALAERGSEVVIGSRTAERAVDAAGLVGSEVSAGVVQGARNGDAVRHAEIVLLCVPARGQRQVLAEIADMVPGRCVVDTCVCEHPRARGVWAPPREGSAAARVRRLLSPRAAVAATLHAVSVPALRQPQRHDCGDVLVAADGPGSRDAAREVLRALGLRCLEAGDLSAAPALEHFALLLHRLSAHHGREVGGARFPELGAPD